MDKHLSAAMNRWRAFESKGEAQGRWIAAADYQDQWFKDPRLGTEFNVYYVCGGEPCHAEGGTVILSKTWKHALTTRWRRSKGGIAGGAPQGTGQSMVSSVKWLCRKEASRGAAPPVPHYCQAAFPYQGVMDAKAMMAEKVFEQAQSPEELFNLIPKVPPLGVGRVLEEWPNAKLSLCGGKAVPGPLPFHTYNDGKEPSEAGLGHHFLIGGARGYGVGQEGVQGVKERAP